MSPDRTPMTRAEAVRRRKEEEMRQKEKLTQNNVTKPRSIFTPTTPAKTRPTILGTGRTTAPAANNKNSLRGRYNTATNSLYGRTQKASSPKFAIPSISLPHIQYGPRWFSFLIALFCVLDMYFMLNSDPFVVRAAEVIGNERIRTQDIQNAMGVINLPAAGINPAQIQSNLLASFPDIASLSVDVQVPGKVIITVEERMPVIAWNQGDSTLWVDAEGFSFPPRGQVSGVLNITASGNPPSPAPAADPAPGTTPFLPAEIFATIDTIKPYLPEGSAVIFDQQYGIGWNDPQGWKVYFGHSDGDNTLKIEVYKSMLAYLEKKNIKPILISVEYPNAPFYRLEQ